MGGFRTILNFSGFGVGISMGLTIGYYLFIYFQPTNVKDPEVRPLVEQDLETLQRMFPEIPPWAKILDYDCVYEIYPVKALDHKEGLGEEK